MGACVGQKSPYAEASAPLKSAEHLDIVVAKKLTP